MRGLTIRQPYAQMIVTGWKKYETRPTRWSYAGPLAIHAGAEPDKKWRELVVAVCAAINDQEKESEFLVDMGFGPYTTQADILQMRSPPAAWAFGAFVGIADVQGFNETHLMIPNRIEQVAGHWGPGCYAALLENARFFKTPLPYVGAQGLFKIASSVEEHLLGAVAMTVNPGKEKTMAKGKGCGGKSGKKKGGR